MERRSLKSKPSTHTTSGELSVDATCGHVFGIQCIRKASAFCMACCKSSLSACDTECKQPIAGRAWMLSWHFGDALAFEESLKKCSLSKRPLSLVTPSILQTSLMKVDSYRPSRLS